MSDTRQTRPVGRILSPVLCALALSRAWQTPRSGLSILSITRALDCPVRHGRASYFPACLGDNARAHAPQTEAAARVQPTRRVGIPANDMTHRGSYNTSTEAPLLVLNLGYLFFYKTAFLTNDRSDGKGRRSIFHINETALSPVYRSLSAFKA